MTLSPRGAGASARRAVAATLMTLCGGCIQMDFFLFDGVPASSVEDDYHGLPLHVMTTPPAWLASASVDRHVYLDPTTGARIPGADLEDHDQYIHGVFLPAPAGCAASACPLIKEKVTFLYQHGNSGHLWRYWYRAVALWSLGANVFIYTYRGYGLSRGEASRASVLADVRAAARYVASRPDVAGTRLLAYGYSMGAIPTSYLVGASELRSSFSGAILESGLDSPESIVRYSTGAEVPGGFFLDAEPFHGPRFMRGAALPVLQIHGSLDERVLPQQAEHYYQVLAQRPDYTHYLGKTSRPAEAWLRKAAHRNVPVHSFAAVDHIADYWSAPENPHHCCVHPLDYAQQRVAGFLAAVGSTTPGRATQDAAAYAELITDWVMTLGR